VQRPGNRRVKEVVIFREPLLQNSPWPQALPDSRIELLGIKQTGSCSFDRRWRIKCNHVELLVRAFEVSAAVVNDQVRLRRTQQILSVRMKVPKKFGYAWHQFDSSER